MKKCMLWFIIWLFIFEALLEIFHIYISEFDSTFMHKIILMNNGIFHVLYVCYIFSLLCTYFYISKYTYTRFLNPVLLVPLTSFNSLLQFNLCCRLSTCVPPNYTPPMSPFTVPLPVSPFTVPFTEFRVRLLQSLLLTNE